MGNVSGRFLKGGRKHRIKKGDISGSALSIFDHLV